MIARTTSLYIRGMQAIMEADDFTPELKLWRTHLFTTEDGAQRGSLTTLEAAEALMSCLDEVLSSKLKLNPSHKGDYDSAREFFNQISSLDLRFNVYSTNYDTVFNHISDNLASAIEGKTVNIDKLIKSEHFYYSYIPFRGTIDWYFSNDGRQVLTSAASTVFAKCGLCWGAYRQV